MTDFDNYDGTSDAVIMMTIHSAKGLENRYTIGYGGRDIPKLSFNQKSVRA